MTFGQQIQSLRKNKGLSQDALAGMLYVTRQSVSQWENDKAMPSVDLLVRLSQIFDITVDKLLGKEDEVSPIASAEIVRDNKLLAKACRFRFCSTITILVSVAVGRMLLLVINLSILPAVYRNLPYQVKFNQIFDDIAIAAACVIIAAVLLIMRFLYQKRVKALAKELSEKIEFFSDSLILHGSDGSPISYFFANLRKIYENDCFLYLTLPTKQTVILDKAAFGEDFEKLLPLLSSHKNYKRKKLLLKSKHALKAEKVLLLKTLNNVLFIGCMVAAISFYYSIIVLRTNGGLSAVARWMIFLAPWVIALLILVVGITECVRKIRAKRVLITGAASLVFLGILWTYMSLLFPLYNFNQRVLSPAEFLAAAEKNHLNVSEANREHLDDYLWECYKAVSDDGSIEITFMHFQEDLRWDSVRSARGAYDSLLSREIAKTNNSIYVNTGDFYCNACQMLVSENGRYSYVSQNHYTVIAVSAAKERMKEIEEIFADYRLQMPY